VPLLQEISLRNASQSFICRCCKVDRPITDGLNTDWHLASGNGVLLEKVDKFYYLGDMLDADGGRDSAVTASQICLVKVSILRISPTPYPRSAADPESLILYLSHVDAPFNAELSNLAW